MAICPNQGTQALSPVPKPRPRAATKLSRIALISAKVTRQVHTPDPAPDPDCHASDLARLTISLHAFYEPRDQQRNFRRGHNGGAILRQASN
jgi:hypothetical protein